jgi:hypothetical protein
MSRPVLGTIDRPLTLDPKKQAPMPQPTEVASGTTAPASGAHHISRQNRNLEMQLMPEAMARAQMRERLQEAEHERVALRVLRARRLQRRAERASLRARRALAMAVMQ